jgi:dihydroxy-acid dehydratase
MRTELRSNYEYGTSRWAVRKAQWRALGLTDEEMLKPKIAVVNSSSELAICFSHLDGVAQVVKDAIRSAGGLPFEVRTTAPSDFIHSAGGGGYILASRDLITNDIEVQVEGAQLDGMICLTSCDKTIPGQLMAAARLNIPTLLVICGYQPSGEYQGEHIDIEEVFLHAAYVAMGRMSADELSEQCETAILGPGVCSGMGTANTMHIVAEALGMALPGHAPVLANSPRMFLNARRAGERIVQMVWEDLTPRQVMTSGAFENAVKAVLGVAGSINSAKHLQATAVEAETDIDVYAMYHEFSREVPVVAAVRPVGDDSIEAFEAAGGARGVMKQLEALLDLDALTVSGTSVRENLEGFEVTNGEVIRPAANPFAQGPGIAIMYGNLAPEGGILKLGTRAQPGMRWEGTALVFDSPLEAMTALREGQVQAGHAVVMRGGGVKGGPGMAGGPSGVVFAIDGLGLTGDVAVVSDGQLSGLVNKGIVIGEISPEGAVGGPIGLVEDGDRIVIDVDARTVDVDVPEDELQARRARFQERLPQANGWLGIYQRTVSSLPHGAVLGRDF